MKTDKHEDNKQDRHSDHDTKFDFSKIKQIFSNTKLNRILLMSILILIPVILTFYIRLMPENLPQTDTWAQSSVDNYFRSQIASVVNSQYPNLPQANKDALINQQFEDFKKNNQAMLDQQVQGTSQFFKQGFQYTENNHTYTFLGDLDSYFYLRQAKNVHEKGMVCDEIVDGKCWDTYLLAPLGSQAAATLHPYGIVFVYRVLNIFTPNVNLMRASFLLPTILAALAAIAAFFLGRRLMNEVAGFFAAMFVALNPMLITRTLGSDTDIWNITLPLIIVWVFVEAFEAESIWKKCILAGLTGLLTGLFSFAWGGWWYIFDFIIAAFFAYLGITLVKGYLQHRNIKKVLNREIYLNLITIGVFFVVTMLAISFLLSFQAFFSVFLAPFSATSVLKAAAKPDLWPNVFTTVAELNEASIAAVISQTGFGINWLFSLACLGIIFTLIKRDPGVKEYLLIAASAIIYLYLVSQNAFNLSIYTYLGILIIPVVAAILLFIFDKNSQVDIKPALLFIIWFMAMIYASIKGVRFILLLTPIFAIAVGVALGYLFQYLTRLLKKELNISTLISGIIIFLVLALVLVKPIQIGLAAGETFTPTMTKGWWDSLTKIKTESAPDAIINSWWDFGHWFKFVADRRVTLDGVTQNHPNAHWLGLILQTKNEKEAIGILRMLDCGSNNAFDEVDKKFQDTEKSENIISELVVLEKTEGESYLRKQGYNQEEITTISNLMYCNPPENYFITSEDMVGKAGVWAHFGLWNFDRAYMVNQVMPKGPEEGMAILKERFNYTDEQAASTYYELQTLTSDRQMNDWIAAWPNYLTGDWLGCVRKNQTDNETGEVTSDLMLCTVNIVVGQDQNGRTLIEGAVYDFINPKNSTLFLLSTDLNGVRLGTGRATPASFILMNEENIDKTTMENTTFPFDVVIDTVNNRALITDPLLSESMFTKLFYLDGRYTEHFEKFSDVTDITGLRIIVWKVKW